MGANAYEVLGRQVVNNIVAQEAAELMGDATIGAFDFTQLVNAAAEAANTGIKYKQDQDAANKVKGDAAAAAQRASAADANWANAEAQLDLATQSKDPQRIGPAQALQMQAMQAAQSAGGGLTSDAQAARMVVDQKAAAAAAQTALSSPGDATKQAMSRAWQKVLSGAGAGGGGAGGGGSSTAIDKYRNKGGKSWWTGAHIAMLAGGTIGGVALLLILVKLLRRK